MSRMAWSELRGWGISRPDQVLAKLDKITSLRAEIERLTRDRDEARAENERLIRELGGLDARVDRLLRQCKTDSEIIKNLRMTMTDMETGRNRAEARLRAVMALPFDCNNDMELEEWQVEWLMQAAGCVRCDRCDDGIVPRGGDSGSTRYRCDCDPPGWREAVEVS